MIPMILMIGDTSDSLMWEITNRSSDLVINSLENLPMTYNQDINAHQIKKEIYPALFAPFAGRKVKKILTLCSTTCGELLYGLDHGHIDLDCEILTFQKCTEWIKPSDVEDKLRQVGFRNFTVIPGKMEDHAAEIIKSHLEKPFDLMFFDWCGTLTRPIYNFLNQISSVIHETISAHTYCLNIRRRDYMYETEDDVFQVELESCSSALSIRGIDIDLRESEGYVKERSFREIAEWTCAMHFEALVDDHCILDRVFVYKERGRGKQTMMFGVYGTKNKPGDPRHRQNNIDILAKLEAEKDTNAYVKGAQKSWTLRRNKTRSLDNLRRQWETEKGAIKAWITRAIRDIQDGKINDILKTDFIVSYKPGNILVGDNGCSYLPA